MITDRVYPLSQDQEELNRCAIQRGHRDNSNLFLSILNSAFKGDMVGVVEYSTVSYLLETNSYAQGEAERVGSRYHSTSLRDRGIRAITDISSAVFDDTYAFAKRDKQKLEFLEKAKQRVSVQSLSGTTISPTQPLTTPTTLNPTPEAFFRIPVFPHTNDPPGNPFLTTIPSNSVQQDD